MRRKKAISGGRQAVVATARKIASIYYKMVTEGVEFDPQVLKFKTQEYLNRRLRYLEKSLQKTKMLLSDSKIVSEIVI